jgi:hypothetical protein
MATFEGTNTYDMDTWINPKYKGGLDNKLSFGSGSGSGGGGLSTVLREKEKPKTNPNYLQGRSRDWDRSQDQKFQRGGGGHQNLSTTDMRYGMNFYNQKRITENYYGKHSEESSTYNTPAYPEYERERGYNAITRRVEHPQSTVNVNTNGRDGNYFLSHQHYPHSFSRQVMYNSSAKPIVYDSTEVLNTINNNNNNNSNTGGLLLLCKCFP